MKRLISYIMAATMMISAMPTTAFAADDVTATAKVIGAQKVLENQQMDEAPELQVKIADSSYTANQTGSIDVEIVLDDAKFNAGTLADTELATYLDGLVSVTSDNVDADITNIELSSDKEELTFTVVGRLASDDVVTIVLDALLDDKTSAGDYATVSIDSAMVSADDLVFATVVDGGFEVSIKDLVDVAVDEVAVLKDIKIEPVITGAYDNEYTFVLEASKGFEFDNTGTIEGDITSSYINSDDELVIELSGPSDIKISGLELFADSAKVGATASIEITLYDDQDKKVSKETIEVAEVVDYTVAMSVDEDKDVPVFYAGVDVDNTGLTDDADHESLTVTISESFAGAWAGRNAFELSLPEGVYVTNVETTTADNFTKNGVSLDKGDWDALFAEAYEEGSYEGFEFSKRTFDDNSITTSSKAAELEFVLTLVADIDFEGEVVLEFSGDAVETQEVVIAEFVAPYTVEAEQNDVIIDYRNTEISTPIIITEAEAELWDDGLTMEFTLESYLNFENDATIEASEDSEMEIKQRDAMKFEVTDESEDEAAVITISDISLYMNRTLPAGSYPLYLSTSSYTAFLDQTILGAAGDVAVIGDVVVDTDYTVGAGDAVKVHNAFVNVVTAGRDQDDTFLTKVIVPIGEYYILASGKEIALDVPAYISEAGYTMLPVRAVSSALGIDTNAVQWNATARQVTIIYGGKVIAMTIGEQYMTVNGTAIATSAAPEITDSRTFLPLRDLATALSVSIEWDAATRTATLN
ncbi:copper amine oxidase N-terminal domain-containing protein [Chakrabartyella piscis]|uniref:copper amine oxidase N-terminal domain-containing protein n=1 Tax=Chakrabartyella piscis TaxID=2918914 RepID=UPI002958D85C|nr:copper amine oxidase N-terminal domain-containing protein [Chakrabartyella piscis]